MNETGNHKNVKLVFFTRTLRIILWKKLHSMKRITNSVTEKSRDPWRDKLKLKLSIGNADKSFFTLSFSLYIKVDLILPRDGSLLSQPTTLKSSTAFTKQQGEYCSRTVVCCLGSNPWSPCTMTRSFVFSEGDVNSA